MWDEKEEGSDIEKLKNENIRELFSEHQILQYEGYLDFIDIIFHNKHCNPLLNKIFDDPFFIRNQLFKRLISPSIQVRNLMQPYLDFLKSSALSVSIHIRQGDLHLGKIQRKIKKIIKKIKIKIKLKLKIK